MKPNKSMISDSGVMKTVSQSDLMVDAGRMNTTKAESSRRRMPKKLLRVASANVDTLLESAKMSIVADTFDKYNIGIAGVQETRWGGAGILEQAKYIHTYIHSPSGVSPHK